MTWPADCARAPRGWYLAGYSWWLWGHGGQFVYAIPASDVLVVQVALPADLE